LSAAVAINVRIGGPLASSSRAEPGAAWLLYGPRSSTKVRRRLGQIEGGLYFSLLEELRGVWVFRQVQRRGKGDLANGLKPLSDPNAVFHLSLGSLF
jgi:hypothetical protein